MVRQKLARAFRIEQPGGRAVPRFDRKLRHDRFDHGIANEKLREVNDKFRQSSVLLRDVLQQQAAVANANHDYEQALLAFWTAKAEFEKALGEE